MLRARRSFFCGFYICYVSRILCRRKSANHSSQCHYASIRSHATASDREPVKTGQYAPVRDLFSKTIRECSGADHQPGVTFPSPRRPIAGERGRPPPNPRHVPCLRVDLSPPRLSAVRPCGFRSVCLRHPRTSPRLRLVEFHPSLPEPRLALLIACGGRKHLPAPRFAAGPSNRARPGLLVMRSQISGQLPTGEGQDRTAASRVTCVKPNRVGKRPNSLDPPATVLLVCYCIIPVPGRSSWRSR